MREIFDNLRNSELFQKKRNLIILAVLLLALPVGVFLITQQQIFKSRATGEPIEFSGSNVEQRGNNWVVLRADQPITLRLTSRLGSGNTPTPTPVPTPVPTPPSSPSISWSGNLLSADMRSGSITLTSLLTNGTLGSMQNFAVPSGGQNVQWFGGSTAPASSGFYKLTGTNTGGSIQADVYVPQAGTNPNQYQSTTGKDEAFRISGNQYFAAILRAANNSQTSTSPPAACASPGNGSIINPSNVTFTWSAVSGAPGYHFRLAPTDTWQEVIIRNDIPGTSFSGSEGRNAGADLGRPINLTPGKTYHWRVWPSNASEQAAGIACDFTVASSTNFSNVALYKSDQRVQWVGNPQSFVPGTYQLSGTVSGDGVIQADVYESGQYRTTHIAPATFTIGSNQYFAVIERVYSGAGSFSNVVLKKQQ